MNMKPENTLRAATPRISLIEARQLAYDLLGSTSSGRHIVSTVRRLREWSARFPAVEQPLPLSHFTTHQLKKELRLRHQRRVERLEERTQERRDAVAKYAKDTFGVDIGTLFPVQPK